MVFTILAPVLLYLGRLFYWNWCRIGENMAQIPPCIGGHVIPSPQIPEIRPLPGLAKWRPTLTSPLLSLGIFEITKPKQVEKHPKNWDPWRLPNVTKLKFALLPDKKILLMKLYRTTFNNIENTQNAKRQKCVVDIFMVLCHWFDDFVLMVQLWFCCGSVSLIWCPLDIIESSKWPLGLWTTPHCKW